MSAVKWTEDQRRVIDTRGRNLLVAAAAGSGKTAVLVERIIQMVTDVKNPVNIDEFLVVTFTKAAASEMREKIMKAVEKALKEDPANTHLQKQLTLIHNAKICTTDSFCNSVVKNHFHQIDLEPGFRIGEEEEMKLIADDVCDRLLESMYEEADPEFIRFINGYGRGRDDNDVKTLIMGTYDFADSFPYPEEWLQAAGTQYYVENEEELNEKEWMKFFLGYIGTLVSDIVDKYSRVERLTLLPDMEKYNDVFSEDILQIKALLNCSSYAEYQECFSSIEFRKLNGIRYKGNEPEVKEKYTAARDVMKKEISKLQGTYFTMDISSMIRIQQKASKVIELLITLVEKYSQMLLEEKKRRNTFGFNDIAHFALDILVDRETKKPTEAACEYKKRFKVVMTDEYQDSNYLQEEILLAVSGIDEGRNNMFMVGDVKQSIYRFRKARPELFVDKYNRFKDDDGANMRIDLHKNFRSRQKVIESVNDIFYKIMKPDMGNVDYDEAAALHLGANYENEESPIYDTEYIVLADKEYSSAQDEAMCIATRIKEMMRKQEIPGLEYRDIVILMRGISDRGELYQKVFSDEGIPLVVASKGGYFTAVEVQTVLSFLSLLDNGRQDIPLTAVMRSPIGNFTDEELAHIRAEYPFAEFYKAVSMAAKSEEKVSRFISMIEGFRKRVPYTPVNELIEQIIDETGYLNYVTALPGGERRKANLAMLVEKAISFSDSSYSGLFHFRRYIDKLIRYNVDYGEAETVSETENAVRVMTIHKSKGLEFPVVFVAGMGNKLNASDFQGTTLYHPAYGVGIEWRDHIKKTKCKTFIREVFAIDIKRESLGEELRILYVALTRAMEKLILVGKSKDFEAEKFVSDSIKENGYLSLSERIGAQSYWDWVLPVLCSTDKTDLIRFWTEADYDVAELEEELTVLEKKGKFIQNLSDPDEELIAEIDDRLSWQYPYEGELPPKLKVSVSELKHRAMEEAALTEDKPETPNVFETSIYQPYFPNFARDNVENLGAKMGSAMHRFMQCLDFKDIVDNYPENMDDVKRLVKKYVDSNAMTLEEGECINLGRILTFFQTELPHRMVEAYKNGTLNRERPFVMGVPAKEVWEDTASEMYVTVQGIIDLYWEEPDGIVLVDYKNDRVSDEEALLEKYKLQLILYKRALENGLADKRVKEVYIYSFVLGKMIPVVE